MAKRMLIDAAHPEETRVVVLNGNRLEEFDFETSTKKQIKGNIYLAKVTRVEPSLQAAFVEYGGNRHGFLAFNEIHPDYYRIPVADRMAALDAEREAEEAANAREDEREDGAHGEDEAPAWLQAREEPDHSRDAFEPENSFEDHDPEDEDDEPHETGEPPAERMAHDAPADVLRAGDEPHDETPYERSAESGFEPHDDGEATDFAAPSEHPESSPDELAGELTGGESLDGAAGNGAAPIEVMAQEEHTHTIETVGGDEIEEATRPRARPYRHYKIQEVIKRRQIMLVQVTKEERGNKGAALTTYLSLAGRYCVLMPNTPRGGGVSRKITNMMDRRRLKDLMSDLDVPEGMGVIVRTAGSERSKPEIKRDFEYLIRLWDEIRDLTLKSTAPALIYEEGSLIKRAIRDLYARELEDVTVDGEEAYRVAKSFMQMLMPSHAKRVKQYRDPGVPLFHRYQVEQQIDAIHSPVVQLRSGGYIVINPTEALVAIDVNSGRSTRERNIEETALKTNLEAAEEVARQLRLRDLAGLIVIDFIDMEEYRNRGAVERRLKDAMRHDRARIQLGRISPFGLLELSRQRLRPSLEEASTQICPYCNGSGHIRSIESTALHVLRAIEEEGMRRRSAEIAVLVPSKVALYVLNHKRGALQQIEARFGLHVTIGSDDTLVPPNFRLDRVRSLTPSEIAALPTYVPTPEPEGEDDGEEADILLDESEIEEGAEADLAGEPEAAEEQPERAERVEHSDRGERRERGGRRRRRRRGGGDDPRDQRPHHQAEPRHPPEPTHAAAEDGAEEAAEVDDSAAPAEARSGEQNGNGMSEEERRHRRRGRRGGRRRRREGAPSQRQEGGVRVFDEGPAHAGNEEGAYASNGEGSYAGNDEGPYDGNGLDAHDEAPEAETPEFVPPDEMPPPEPESEAPMPVAAHPAPPETAPDVASVPVAEAGEARHREPAPEPPANASHNTPPAIEVTSPPANPRKGWWRR